jgi:hypothetical protein
MQGWPAKDRHLQFVFQNYSETPPMKFSHYVAGALLGTFTCFASAQSSVTIFGIADAAVRHVKNGSLPSANSVISGGTASSRIGLRGIEDLGGGLRAGFWLESDVALDTGVGNPALWNRRSTLSLISATAGEVRIGRDMVPSIHLPASACCQRLITDPASRLCSPGLAACNSPFA